MDEHEFEIFVRVQGDVPKVALVLPSDTLSEVLARIGGIEDGRGDMLVFVGECEDALSEPEGVDDGEDDHAPVEVGLTLEVLDLHRRRHVHCHNCHRIATEVNFGGKTIRRKFSPATTVGVVAEWARRKFRLDAAAAAEYVLQLVGTIEQPRPNVHLGELVGAPKCSLGFDLVKELSPQG